MHTYCRTACARPQAGAVNPSEKDSLPSVLVERRRAGNDDVGAEAADGDVEGLGGDCAALEEAGLLLFGSDAGAHILEAALVQQQQLRFVGQRNGRLAHLRLPGGSAALHRRLACPQLLLLALAHSACLAHQAHGLAHHCRAPGVRLRAVGVALHRVAEHAEGKLLLGGGLVVQREDERCTAVRLDDERAASEVEGWPQPQQRRHCLAAERCAALAHDGPLAVVEEAVRAQCPALHRKGGARLDWV
mmetsp:Transcript_18949/g.73010  ORF Transcript_18949/g.73010 Transcript_18949/m.73010 type:complete len:246 (-) Transcript_18949:95-832(-)